MSDAGGFDNWFKKATASAKVLVKDVAQGTVSLANKVAETDMQATARRLTHKVMEKADSNFVNVEELPEVESAMLNLKQTDVAYRELLAVMLEAFVAQARAGNLQLRAANRADVIGRDLESDLIGQALCSFGNHLTVTAERNQELNNLKEAAEVEERALDDFETRVYDTPAARLIQAIETFVHKDLALALIARVHYKDTRREVSLSTRRAADLESKGQVEQANKVKAEIAIMTNKMDHEREELMRHFMLVEQRKPALQSSVNTYLQAQLQYHQQCALSTENSLASVRAAKVSDA